MTPRLTGKEKVLAEMNLKTAMNNAYKSVAVVTTFIHSMLDGCTEDDTYYEILQALEEEFAASDMELIEEIDRIKLSLGLVLYCSRKANIFISFETQAYILYNILLL